jgi:hypothetical protein
MDYSNSHDEEKAHIAPEPQSTASPMDSIKHYNYHNLARLIKATIITLIISAAWNWIRSWSVTNMLLMHGLGKLTRNFPWLPLQAFILRNVLGYDAITLTAYVLFLVWVYGAYRNALALGAAGLTFTPNMAIGIYFVPIINLWWPYQAMRETLLASQKADGEPDAPKPRLALVGWWWAAWLISFTATVILHFRNVLQKPFGTWLNDLFEPVLLLVSVARPVLTIVLITRITAMQTSRAKAIDIAFGGSVRGENRPRPGN